MKSDRGVSTPIDVVLGLLLVGIATGVVATAAPTPVEKPPQGGQEAILGSSLTVEFETEAGNWTVRNTVGGHLAAAARAGQSSRSDRASAYRSATQAAVSELVETHGMHVQILGACRGPARPTPLVAGRTPPPDRPVSATVYERPGLASDGECQPVVVLRRWSP